jgi:hypothetical protein
MMNEINTLKSELHLLQLVLQRTSEFEPSYTLDMVLAGIVNYMIGEINNKIDPIRPNKGENNKEIWKIYVEKAVKIIYTELNVFSRYNNQSFSPKSFSIAEINNKINSERLFTLRLAHLRSPRRESATFHIVQGVDALILSSSDKYAENSIIQVASQFNFLESKTENYTGIEKYIEDQTQGPRASLGSLAALMIRDFYFRDKDNNADFFIFSGCYSGGYFMPYLKNKTEQNRIYRALKTNIGNLRILAQWGIPYKGRPPLLQIFTAAPSYQDSRTPDPGSVGEKICQLLVEAQYRAVAQIAVMRSLVLGGRVNLHLTLVGQGAFNNPETVLKSALKAVHKTVACYNVDVYIHGYGDNDVKKISRNLPLDNINTITKDEFFA